MDKKNSYTPIPFNPLDKKNLGTSVAEALLEKEVHQLPPLPFIGAGIYAIYYIGDFPLYKIISNSNVNNQYKMPIYIGKAVPSGARKGGFGLDEDPGNVLFSRIKEHANSIDTVSNLKISDFFCRYLVVDDIWIPLAESLLISMFNSLWNIVLDGFGNHDPGSGRYEQQKSNWDFFHPGRTWANKLKDPSLSFEDLKKQITAHLEKHNVR